MRDRDIRLGWLVKPTRQAQRQQAKVQDNQTDYQQGI